MEQRSSISSILALRNSEFHFCSAQWTTIFRAYVPSDADTTIGTAMPLESLRLWGDSHVSQALQQTLAQLFIVDCADLDQRREEEILHGRSPSRWQAFRPLKGVSSLKLAEILP